MRDIEIRISKDLVLRKLKDVMKMEDLEIELLGDTFRLILKVGAFIFKMPISISIKLLETQRTPEDPLVFEIIANPFVKAIIQKSGIDGKGIKIVDGYVKIYPAELIPIMKTFTVDSVEFLEDSIFVALRFHEG